MSEAAERGGAMSLRPDAQTDGWNRVVWTLAVALSLLIAMACNLVLEVLQVGGNLHRVITFTLDEKLLLFLLGSGLIWWVLVLVWAATGRLRIAATTLTLATVLLGYANYQKITLRMEPLYPSDFAFAGEPQFLGQMVGPRAIAVVLTVLGLLTFILLFSSHLLARRWPRGSAQLPRSVQLRRGVGRLLVIGMSMGVLAHALNFNQTDNYTRAAYEASGAHWKFWFQRLNYYTNGFVGGMLYNTAVPAMERPSDYSLGTMKTVERRYQRLADERNQALSASPEASTINVVLVLSEAFSDPTAVKGVSFDEDPIPYTRELMSRTPSGQMLAQLYGGGTANMEFEVLTGMSLAQFTPQMQTPYQMLVPDHATFPSGVGYAAGLGQRPIAVHPYMTSMYKREQTYPILGFQDFIGEDDMESTSRIDKSEFISDESAFSEVWTRLDRSETPLLVNLVTMQNHYPMGGSYEDPVSVNGIDGEFADNASGYARGLQHTDDALERFLERLQRFDEPTAVIFYGDHQPAIWPEAVQAENGTLAMRTTPFFLWANFKLQDVATAQYTSPIYFLPLLYEASGLPVPPFYALLLELYQHFPAMAQGTYLDADGREIDPRRVSPEAQRLLHDYRLLQYDLSVGKRHAEATMFPQGAE